MVAVGYYVEHVFFCVALAANTIFWGFVLSKQLRNKQPREYSRLLGVVSFLLLLVLYATIVDWRGVYGIISASVLYLFSGLTTFLLYAVLAFFLFAFLSSIYVNSEFDLRYATNDPKGSVKSLRIFFIVITILVFAGFVAKTVVIFVMQSSTPDSLSVYEACWLYWLSLNLLVIGIVFLVLSMRLRCDLL